MNLTCDQYESTDGFRVLALQFKEGADPSSSYCCQLGQHSIFENEWLVFSGHSNQVEVISDETFKARFHKVTEHPIKCPNCKEHFVPKVCLADACPHCMAIIDVDDPIPSVLSKHQKKITRRTKSGKTSYLE